MGEGSYEKLSRTIKVADIIQVVILLVAGMLVLTFLKRLEANHRPLPPSGPERRWVVVRRLFLDRDIMDHRVWIDRQPGVEADHAPMEGAERSDRQ